MIDLHCHLLPGVDDGAPDLETALEMAQLLVRAGFSEVAASPHFGEGPGGDVAVERAAETRALLQGAIEKAGIPLGLLPNAEHYVSPALFERAAAGLLTPIGGRGRWLLVELPWERIAQPEVVLFRLQAKGWKLLLAHPERYGYMEPAALRGLVERGVRMQLEIGSFIGAFGDRAARRAEDLMARGHAHVLATDLHRPKQGEDWLAAGLAAVSRRYGAEALTRGTLTNPRALLADAALEDVEPLVS